MKIIRVLNNNAVVTSDDQGQDIIALGSGIAFQKKSGDLVDEKSVDRIFYQDSNDLVGKLKRIFSEIPIEFIEMSEEIISDATVELGKEYNTHLSISLPDHIQFVIQRYHSGIEIHNPLSHEIKQMYHEEYRFAKKKLGVINDRFNVQLPEDEATSIVLHLVNAELTGNMSDTMHMIELVQNILEIIKNDMGIVYDEESLDYYRLMTHLKFFYRRLYHEAPKQSSRDIQLLQLVKERYSKAFSCAEKVKSYLLNEEKTQVTDDDLLYLTIHIQKVSN
ncbi:BglG family transcription antiterminator LicT [Fundicoccus culcitae]|uniref:PRD domain-containing protein n=1 Tax=Fundicoccus culcitae TaxID=2969821 RepID=A0ABY5P4V3_9LACT|nr:PRD domain-containing protein [Fundicoccus culcitae]UUX33772.1 PRD domain-containing protein [Fundicoccus culcitae]